jgi:tetratricopeptide (TPR) repeat protein
MVEDGTKDFFISYNKADRGWAEWIAWQLNAEGYSVILQAWDFRPGGNFVLQMDEAITHTKRTILLLSPNYLDLKAVYSHAEWAASFTKDPAGQKGILLPIRVRKCKPTGLLATITYIDIVDLNATDARNAILAGVRQSRALPTIEPHFPGTVASPLPPVPSFPGEWPEVWQVPYRRNPFFTGREELLARLHEQLATKGTTALSQASAISGLGGIGKTQTALEYAYRYERDYRYVLWVSAEKEDVLRAELTQLAASLKIAGYDPQNQPQTIELFKRWLAQQPNWLLILDNADDLQMASKYLPYGNRIQGHILLTTRASTGGAFAQILEVEKMEHDEGTLLLLRRANLLPENAPLEQASQQDRANAQAIVTALDGLPLALDQAGAYIDEMSISLSSYLTLYQKRRTALLAHRGQLPPGHSETVATTWNISFQQVEQTNPAAADLLRLCAFLSPDAIPETILTEGASVFGRRLKVLVSDAIEFNKAIQLLRHYSLIRRNPEANTLSIHRLVQAVIQDTQSPKERRIWSEQAVRAVNAVFPSESWLPIQPLLPHALACANLIDQFQYEFSEASRLLDRTATYLQDAGRYKEAEPLFERALAIDEKMQGAEHPVTGIRLNNLAELYREQGKYEEALPLYERALVISEKMQGAEHPNTGTSLNNLASLYQAQGGYEEALPLYERALVISEKMQGAEHPNTGTRLNNLAELYRAQGRYSDAEPLYERALAISEKMQGAEHPETGVSLNNLAELYREQGRYAEALPLYERALAISEKTMGLEHPSTAITLHSLAYLYYQQGHDEEAEMLYRRALAIYEKTLPENHPWIANLLGHYASLLQQMQRPEEAAQLQARAQAIYAKRKQ